MIRGGSWNNDPRNCRPANRNRNTPENRNNNLGFRVAAALPARWIPRRTGPAARLPRSRRFRPGERRLEPPRAGSDREGSGRSFSRSLGYTLIEPNRKCGQEAFYICARESITWTITLG